MNPIYLDHNATTPVDPEVREAMLPYLGESFGNPSSLHGFGAKARKAVDEAREKVASCLMCRPDEIVFTSGGTESIHLALHPIPQDLVQNPKAHVITSSVEHQSVLQPLERLEKQGWITATRLVPDSLGNISVDEVAEAVCDNTALISILFVNNETGNLYPIEGMGRLAREKGILFHVDGVQALGKIPINLSRLSVDLMSFSAHKIYGPKGVGALYVKKGVRLAPLLQGGFQERGLRAGTENVPGIVGFGHAMEIAHRNLEIENLRIRELRDFLERGLQERIPGVILHGDPDHRVANTLNVAFEGVSGETALIALDREGIAVSAGSACASGALEPSHVLLAMGIGREEAKSSLRFSLGRGTQRTDIDQVLEKLPGIIERLRGK